MKKLCLLLLLMNLFLTAAYTQDALSLLEDDDPYVTASFKTTRIINGHSVEQPHGGVLDFRINHRFGFVNSGASELFGLDNASARIGFDYGLTDRWMIGVGRSGFNKVYDFSTKYKLLRQSTLNTGSPVTMSIFTELEITTIEYPDPERNADFNSRLDYAASLLIARKFSDLFTFQLSPTWIHRNLVNTAAEKNDLFALGVGGRIKLSKRLTFNAEYFYVGQSQLTSNFNNSIALGFDIETGGHVFQLDFTNSTAMVYNGFIGETTGNFFDGDIHFGFNISRVFTLKKPK